MTRQGGNHARILRQVPGFQGDTGCQVHHNEERQAGYPGHVPGMQHEDVQDRQSVKALPASWHKASEVLERIRCPRLSKQRQAGVHGCFSARWGESAEAAGLRLLSLRPAARACRV